MNNPDTLLYLREDVYFEPLLHKWYVWPYMLPPISAAMNITGRSLRSMKSFVSNYQLHIAASNNPELAGGDFVNCTAEQVDDVKRLIGQIETEYTDYFEIRKAITQLNELMDQQKGMSLENLYDQVPAILRGYVELVYDMNHHATFRLIEGLLYEGDLYKEQAQSVSFGILSRVKERPFVLSSPRLPDANHLHLEIAFSDPVLDRIFALRYTPAPQSEVAALFADLKISGGLPWDALFTSEAPKRLCPPLKSDVRIRYLGHAGLLLETKHTSIMVDPVIACRDDAYADDIVSFCELPETIDYICVTHTHMDHVCVETLLQLRHKTRFVVVPKNNGGSIVDPSIKLMLKRIGFNVLEMEDMEQITCPDGTIRAIPFLGEHADLNIRSKSAWYFEFYGKKIFSGADSSSLDPVMYQRIEKVIGKIDQFYIGMECVGAPMSWLYGALFTKPVPRAINESRRFNGSDFASARKLLDIFTPREVYIYALGMEPWFKYFMGVDYTEDARQIQESNRMLEHCAEQGIHSERLFAKRVWDL